MSTNPHDEQGSADAQTFRATALSASLSVKDLQKSLEWYCDVLGLVVERKYEREGTLMAVALQAGDVRILISQDDGAKGWDRAKGEGLSLQFSTHQNIDDVAARIKQHGGTLESEPFDAPWGVRAFRLVDPDGFRFVISSIAPR
ncbi:MAG: VOC family protein [Acidobacteriota bacterium]